MSRHRTIGLTDYAVSLIDNWIANAHSGNSVVPRDFHREIDRHEPRAQPNALWAAPVEAIYRELWESDPVRHTAALCVAAFTFGAPRNRLQQLNVTKSQADTWLWLFGYEVNLVDLAKVGDSAKLNVRARESYAISKEFGDLRKPLPREKIARDSSVWAGGVRVSKLFN
ncbi:MAG: hypothetical protein ACRCWJ_11590 [Casimicrobium sp.]